MKVHELIELLQACDQNAEVETEGCDCIGQASSVSQEGGTVCINRGLDGDWPGRLEAERRQPEKTLAHIAEQERLRQEAVDRQIAWYEFIERESS